MNHLHTYLYLENDGSIQVSLDSPGNVYLMNGTEYKKYVQGGEFTALGGLVKARKKVIHAPSQGKWHLVIDNDNKQESINVALNITKGRQIHRLMEQSELDDVDLGEDQGENDLPAEQEDLEINPQKSQDEASDKEQQKLLRKEIIKKLKDIDIEGLKFLVNQAKILAHNREIEEANDEIIRYNEDYVIHNRTKKTKQKESSEKVLVDVEEHSDKAFILVLCGARKILSRQELRIVVTMAHNRITDNEFAHTLFEWLKIRRNDILFDAHIRSPDHMIWPILRRFLRNNYKAKK